MWSDVHRSFNSMAYLDKFYYQLYGSESNTKLVFLHGLMGSGRNWGTIIQGLKDDFHILALDQRGHGRSFHPPSGYHPKDFAQDLAILLDELQWKQIALVGHSLGGRVALEFATLWPERLSRLVIEDISPGWSIASARSIEQYLAAVPTPFRDLREAKLFLLTTFAEKYGTRLAQFLLTNITETPEGTADWRFFKPGILEALYASRKEERWEQVKKLSLPTLVVRGENSQDLSRADFERMLASNPNFVRGCEIADSGHWVHFEKPTEFTRTLREFLLEL